MGQIRTSLLTLGLCGLVVAKPGFASAADESPLAFAKKLNQAFVQVVEKVSPSVVVIKVTQKANAQGRMNLRENPFFEFMPEDMRERMRERMENAPRPEGQGSGFVIRKDGYILTNRHVVENAEKIRVVLQTGREYDATVQGLDPESDLAVIKVDVTGLPAVKFGSSDKTKVGEFAIAIGAPFELDYSVTIGHISAKGRAIHATREMSDADFIQTDASINPGNSGGPLVNIDGEVIGVNTMIRGIGTGIGFSIPSKLAKEISDSLIEHGKMTRAWLGISVSTLREDPEVEGMYPDLENGVVVKEILRNGPAAGSKLRPADVILEVAGKRVITSQQLINEVRNQKIGAPLKLTVHRRGKELDVTVKPGERPEAKDLLARSMRNGNRSRPTAPQREKELGLVLEDLSAQLARQAGVDAGVLVSEVAEDSAAAARGISPGDVITEINRKEIASVSDVREALRGADLVDGVVVHFVSDGTSKFRVLKKR
ncbi:MAG: trypsin-like peptidase domain-containing protein [Limisphaerales bacterium]